MSDKLDYADAMVSRRADLKFLAIHRAKEKAQRIGMCSWMETIEEFLTDAEKVEIKTLWATMPGSSCWNDAMLRWMVQT